jgi:ribosomal protein S18 acetylase RimI-like enzyme
MNISIKKLEPSRVNDYMRFFDNIAFCDNPAWSLCYCCFYYLKEEDEPNEDIKNSIRTYAMDKISNGTLNGFLACSDGEPVGWCNADILTNYKRIMDNDEILKDASKKVGAIVCFVIDPNHRGKGIAAALLEAACDLFTTEGYDWIEAYPAKEADTPAENYHGPIQMYLNHGFEVIEELDTFYIVRRIS